MIIIEGDFIAPTYVASYSTYIIKILMDTNLPLCNANFEEYSFPEYLKIRWLFEAD